MGMGAMRRGSVAFAAWSGIAEDACSQWDDYLAANGSFAQ